MSLMHNIRNFAEIQLQGVIPWSKFSFPDETHTDVANVSIEGKHGLYRVVVSSSYAVPPLGKVVFKDHSQGHEIEGQNQDETWHRIAEYLKTAEGGEMRGGLKTEGLLPNDPIGDFDGADQIIMRPAAGIIKVIPLPVTEIPIPPIAFVYYISDPGVWYQNGPALVTRVNADGSYNLTVFPDGSDPFYRQNVGQRSDMLRNICWVEYRSASGKSMAELQATVDMCMNNMSNFMAQPKMLVADGEGLLAPADESEAISELRALVTELQDKIGMLKQSAFDQRKSA